MIPETLTFRAVHDVLNTLIRLTAPHASIHSPNAFEMRAHQVTMFRALLVILARQGVPAVIAISDCYLTRDVKLTQHSRQYRAYMVALLRFRGITGLYLETSEMEPALYTS